jgi:hypothetical protein
MKTEMTSKRRQLHGGVCNPVPSPEPKAQSIRNSHLPIQPRDSLGRHTEAKAIRFWVTPISEPSRPDKRWVEQMWRKHVTLPPPSHSSLS